MNLNAVRFSTLLRTCAVLPMLMGLYACGGGGTDAVSGGPTAQNVGSPTQNTGPAGVTGSTTLNWTAPAARSDGSSLALADIGGYRIFYGSTSGSYSHQLDVTDPTATSFTLTDVPVGTYYFVMTAYDNSGRESLYSPEISQLVN